MPILIAIIEALIDGTLILACFTAFMAVLGAISMLGAFGFALMALTTMIKAIFRTPHKVIKRRYINNDGRDVIEEIPYSPAMNMLNVATHTVKEIGYDRERQN